MRSSVAHVFLLIRSSRIVIIGLLQVVMIIMLFMGWLAVAFSRLNPYMLLLSFSLFNAVLVLPAALFPVRREDISVLKLQTNLNRLRSTISGSLAIGISLILIMNLLFEIIMILFRSSLEQIFAPFIVANYYVPDFATFILIAAAALTYYGCFGAYIPWIVSQLEVSEPSEEDGLVSFVGILRKPTSIMVLAALVVAGLVIYVMFQAIMSPSLDYLLTSDPVIWGLVSIGANMFLSLYLWKDAWRTIEAGIDAIEGQYAP
ncbi:MAG: hypothetical protein ACFFEA_14760 [Candidatus Thorarchaeota archaeon]